ncbi:MAG: elongation factor G [candidate division NC10 bacterium]
MKGFDTARIRNVGMLGHGGDGKTSLTEALLFATGSVPRLGRIEDGTTSTDFEEDEVKHQKSINVAVAFCEWRGHRINLVDTPGFSNFLADTRSAVRVLDTALILMSAASGVKVTTTKVWGYAEAEGVPRVLYVNKMDRDRANFPRVLEDARKNLSAHATPVMLPMGAEAAFRGVITLLSMRALTSAPDGTGKVSEGPIPAEFAKEAEAARHALLEQVAESDDALLEKYLETGTLEEADLKAGLRRAILLGKLIPVCCGSATKVVGIQALLDFIAEYLPSPADRPPVEGTDPKTKQRVSRPPREEAPLVAQVFKTFADPYAGKISLVRVYGGVLSADAPVYNATRQVKERIGQLTLLRGKAQTPVPAVGPGEVCALVKLKETATGDTLADEKAPVLLEPIPLPNPVISYAIAPKSKGDEERMSAALARLREEDPSLQVGRDQQTRETLISGMGRVHIEVAVERLKRKFGVEVQMQKPRVPYKETFRGTVQAQGKYKKQTGGRGQYGDCWIKLEPVPRGKGYEFANQIVGGVIPGKFIPAVEKGIVEAMEGGVLAGYPVVDVKITLYDGSYHSVDSSEMAFKIAGSLGFKKAAAQATPVLLEPIMTVEVVAPDECVGDIIGDLNSRRGRVMGVEGRARNQAIKAQVPLAEMLEYAPQLRSLTGDRGDYTMEFSHYEEVPPPIQERVVAEAKKAAGEEGEEP